MLTSRGIKLNIIAIIPARGGSKGIKRKNIINFKGKPLIAHTILLAKKSEIINETYVWTDDKKIADISKKYGAKVPLLRPKSISKDNSLDIEVINHFYDWYLTKNNKDIDLIIHLRATSPYRKLNLVNKAIQIMKKNKSFSALRSFKIAKNTPYKMWKKSGKLAIPLIETKKELHSAGRQFLPEIYMHTGYVDILRPKKTILKKSMVGKKVFFNEINKKEKYIDIDTKEDLK